MSGPQSAPGRSRPALSSRLNWAVLLASPVASALVYTVGFVLPMWLPAYYAIPHLDTPKLMGVTVASLSRFVLAALALFGIYLAGFHASLRLRSHRSALLVLGLAAIVNVSLLPMYPGGAGDLYAYIAEADIILRYHANPFTTPAAAFPDHPILPYLDFPHETTHYGPLWLVIASLLRLLSGGNLLAALLVFKASAALFLLGTSWLVYLYLRKTNSEVAIPGSLLVAWNPLLVFELAGNGHNDIAMMLFVALAFYFHARGSHRLAVTALLAAVLVKYVVVILVPLFIVAMLRQARHPSAWVGPAVVYSLGAVAVGAGLLAVVGTQGTLGILDTQSSQWFTTSPAAVAELWLSRIMSPESAMGLTRLGCRALYAMLYMIGLARVWLCPRSLAKSSFWTMLLLMLVAVTWFQPWYVVWVVPLASLAATRTTMSTVIVLSAGAFMVHAIMGFIWRLEWSTVTPLAINAMAVAAVWIPTGAAVAISRLLLLCKASR